MVKDYTIGLDIGTNSVGYAVVVDDYKVPAKRMKVLGNTGKKYIKKNLIGALLFDEGNTAADRRLKRNTRRRLNRRRQRILYLQEIFEKEIEKIDNAFFHRLDESFLVSQDKKYDSYPVFGKLSEEKEYHKNYPTIYHLREKLANDNERADLRLIYLALAHIIKYRGNFLVDGEINTKNLSIVEQLSNFIDCFNLTFEKSLTCDFERAQAILSDKISKSKKLEDVIALFEGEKKQGELAEFFKLIIGNVANFKKFFDNDKDLKLQITKDTFDNDLEEVISEIGEEYSDIFNLAKSVYDSVVLSSILNIGDRVTNAPLSTSMVIRYEEHKEDLRKFKSFILEQKPELFFDIFKDKSNDGYASYIGQNDKRKTVSEEKFYKYIKGKIKDVEGSSYFLEKMEQGQFLRKQRTYDNGSIPNQVHLSELRAILDKQGQYYPFLKENHKRIEQILTFKIPYYVGPLANGFSEFAWLKRQKTGSIRPWNFDEMVDKDASAVEFIERMTSRDTYLPCEKVLPKHSLLYEKFLVFNELTKVKYITEQGKHFYLSSDMKKEIFENVFKKYRKVKKNHLLVYLKNEYPEFRICNLSGLDKEKEEFNASIGTYHDLVKILDNNFMDSSENSEIIEEIIYNLTIFEDKEIIVRRLRQLDISLSDRQIKELSRRHYTGWGKFSKKLINGIKNKENGKTMLDFLVDDGTINRNFMQLINDEKLSFIDEVAKAQNVKLASLNEMVEDIAGSPAIKKGILQSLKIVEELIQVMGGNPQNIVIEMSRENQTTKQGRDNSKKRFTKIKEGLTNLGSDILDKEEISENQLSNDKLFLYCMQNGKDIYTGCDLNISEFKDYDIDHIIPQSLLKDDSIDNRVLTRSKENRGKSDNVPSEEVVRRMKGFWKKLYESNLISKVKFDRLTKSQRGGLTDRDKEGFINRQLVETRQITKHVARILDARFNSKKDKDGKVIRDVKVLTLKSSLVSSLRKELKLYKVREINDYHHAHDAYLNAVVGKALLGVYPHLERKFVYGEYKTFTHKDDERATKEKIFYSNLLNFVTKDDENLISIWDKSKHIPQIKKVLEYPQINIVKKVEKQKGGFSKETIKPKGESDSLLERKRGWDTKFYGGFDSPIIAYSVFVCAKKKKGKQFKRVKEILGVQIMEVTKFEENPIDFLEAKGYIEIEETNLLILPKYSLFEFENGRRRLLASATELQKGNEIFLPQNMVTLLYHAKRAYQIKDIDAANYISENIGAFNELLDFLNSFAEKFIQADKNLSLIKDLVNKNENSPVEQISESYLNLLAFVALGAPSDFKFFGKNIPRKRYKSLTECTTATLIRQSITGLYETRIDLGKL